MKQSSRTLPVLDVTDSESSFRQLAVLDGKISNAVQELNLDYINRVVGTLMRSDDPFMLLRDSIEFRRGAIFYHAHLLLETQNGYVKSLNKKPFNQELRTRILIDGSQRQIQLFDSIVFHTISLFDYLGNLVDYLSGGRKSARLKWNGLLESVRDPSNPLSKLSLSPVLSSWHRTFVDPLYAHRSDLIHLKADMSGAQVSFDPMTGDSGFVPFAPKRIVRRFPELHAISDQNRLSLNYVVFWVLEKSLTGCLEIIGGLIDHIRLSPKTRPGPDFIVKQKH